MMKTKLQKEDVMGEYRQDMIQRMVSTLVAGGVPQERAQLIAAEHAAGESTMEFRPGSALPVSRQIWKFHATAMWADVPLAGVYTEYDTGGKIIREVSVDSARAQAAAVLGSISTPKKTAAARENAKKGGYPKGRPRNTGLTALQRQALDLRQQGLSIREIAARMGRQPENVRQLLARARNKIERG